MYLVWLVPKSLTEKTLPNTASALSRLDGAYLWRWLHCCMRLVNRRPGLAFSCKDSTGGTSCSLDSLSLKPRNIGLGGISVMIGKTDLIEI